MHSEVLVDVSKQSYRKTLLLERAGGRALHRCSGTGYNQSRRLLLENNRKAASGFHLGAEGSNPREKKKSQLANRGS